MGACPWTLHQREDHSADLHQFMQLFYCTSRSCLLILHLQGKMKLFVFLLFVILAISDAIKFNPDLQKNILKFGYGINYKYEDKLAHSFDRVLYCCKIYVTFNGAFKIFQPKFLSFLHIHE